MLSTEIEINIQNITLYKNNFVSVKMYWDSPTISFSQPVSSRISEYILLIACMVFVCWMMLLLWRRRKLYQFASTIRGPFSYPLLGSKLFICNTSASKKKQQLVVQLLY